VESGVEAETARLSFQLISLRPVAPDLETSDRTQSCDRRDERIDAFPGLEVRRRADRHRLVPGLRPGPAQVDAGRDGEHAVRRKSVLDEEPPHRVGRRDHRAEPSEHRLDPEVPMREPGDSKTRGIEQVLVRRRSDTVRDLLRNAVDRVNRLRPQNPAERTSVQTSSAILRVDDVRGRKTPAELPSAGEVRSSADRSGMRADTEFLEGRGDRLRLAQERDIDARSSQTRQQVLQV
jgi:hypothetical protein